MAAEKRTRRATKPRERGKPLPLAIEKISGLPPNYLPHDLMRLFNAMNLRLQDLLRPINVNITQWRVMQALQFAPGGVSIGEVARETVIEQSTCSRLVDRLEERGLVARSRSRSNPKVVEIRLTEAGADIMREMTPHALAIVADTMSVITADEARTLHELLTRLYEHTRRHRRWP